MLIAQNEGETPAQAEARKSANNAVPTVSAIPGPIKLRYTGNVANKSLYVEASVPIGTTMRLEVVSGTYVLLGNIDGNGLSSDVDYGFGPNDQPGYNAQWAMGQRTNNANSGVPNERLRLIFKNSAGVVITKIEYMPYTVSARPLMDPTGYTGTGTGTGTSTGTSTGTGLPASYSKVLLVGNSITHHPAIPEWENGTRNWGMDATSQANDYWHKLKVKTANTERRR